MRSKSAPPALAEPASPPRSFDCPLSTTSWQELAARFCGQKVRTAYATCPNTPRWTLARTAYFRDHWIENLKKRSQVPHLFIRHSDGNVVVVDVGRSIVPTMRSTTLRQSTDTVCDRLGGTTGWRDSGTDPRCESSLARGLPPALSTRGAHSERADRPGPA